MCRHLISYNKLVMFNGLTTFASVKDKKIIHLLAPQPHHPRTKNLGQIQNKETTNKVLTFKYVADSHLTTKQFQPIINFHFTKNKLKDKTVCFDKSCILKDDKSNIKNSPNYVNTNLKKNKPFEQSFAALATPRVQKNQNFVKYSLKQNVTMTSKKKEETDEKKCKYEDQIQRFFQTEIKTPKVIDSFDGSNQPSDRLKNSFNINEDSSKRTDTDRFFQQNSLTIVSNYSLSNTSNIHQKQNSVINSSNKFSSGKYSSKYTHYKNKKKLFQIQPFQVKIKDFICLKELGAGKYGKVWLVLHKATGFLFALKSITKKVIKQETIIEPLIHEIKIQTFLNHPNIVQLYGYFHDEAQIYLILQYCSNGHLKNQIKGASLSRQKQILQKLSNIFEAVAFLHSQGVIHRDLKPENIVLSYGVCKLCDFGWAVYAGGDNRRTFCGTPLYVSPQILQSMEYSSSIDVWSLGIIAYQLVFGQAPFPILERHDMKKIITDPVYFPQWKMISNSLIRMIQHMLEKKPQKRPTLNQVLSLPLFHKLFLQNKINQNQVQFLC